VPVLNKIKSRTVIAIQPNKKEERCFMHAWLDKQTGSDEKEGAEKEAEGGRTNNDGT
jgi:hypothetical protein